MTYPASSVPNIELRLHLAGAWLLPLPQGALWWETERCLIVSDLHLEKGSAYAALGQLLPPYDSALTLSRLAALAATLHPRTILSLGDSLHDRQAETRLSESAIQAVRALTHAHDFVWIEGNHDPLPPAYLGGRAAHELRIGDLVFRHEPSGAHGEISGHLHPIAKIKGRGGLVRRRCFVTDGTSLILPAFGAYTGGLNVLDPAFQPLFPEGASIFATGDARVYGIARQRLIPDTGR
jgi:hypothetical protein